MSSKLSGFNKGFSLVDLLIAIAIIGILAALLLPILRAVSYTHLTLPTNREV